MAYNAKNYLWEAVASYMVNDFFSYIYSAAKSSTNNNSLTEAYQHKVELYIRGIKSVEQNYRHLCSDLHRFISKSSRFNSLMYGEFVDRLVQSFTPQDYYEVLTKQQKDELFSSIINDLVAAMGSFCIKPDMLRKIIDEHEKSKHITQDIIYREALQNLAIKKENLTHSFISNMGQVKDTVPIETVNRYIEQVNTLTTENENLKSLISDLEEEAETMENKFKEKEQKYRKLIDFLQKNNVSVHQIPASKQANVEVQTAPSLPPPAPAPPPPAVLSEENLKKHTENVPKAKTVTLLDDED